MAQTNTERETRDFMSVESFSQLPFIRSAPPLTRDKGAGAIRLFGKEFGSNNIAVDDQSDSNDNNNGQEIEANKEGSDGTESSSSRKFECHYCCRNFPTSQALGGHQNAHKRERQQAKRAHLQSTMLHGSLADPHVYGLMNYSRLGSAPPLPMPYHSWTTNAAAANSGGYSASSRIYGGYGSYTPQPQPINGSPLAFWRVPAAQSPAAYHPTPPLMFTSKDEQLKPLPSSITTISASQLRFGYESKPNEREREAAALQLSEGPRINRVW